MNQSTKEAPQQSAHTAKMIAVCSVSPAQRIVDDIWFIRDRLHERSSFFRLWPSQLQQLICRLAQPQHWVQNEVASQGTKPSDLCFILEGQAAVAVRDAPGSCQLKDIAMLQPGDTFGESSLLGAQRHSAVIVVRSKELLVLAVNAHALAQAMMHQQQQSQAPCKMPSSTAEDVGKRQQPTQQQMPWCPTDSRTSTEVLYTLIGEERGKTAAALSSEQHQQIKAVQQQQLQAAADAEAITVGSWLTLPHELAGAQSSHASSLVTVHSAGGADRNSPSLKKQQCHTGSLLKDDHSQTSGIKQLLPGPTLQSQPRHPVPATSSTVMEKEEVAAGCIQHWQMSADDIDACLLVDSAGAQDSCTSTTSQQRNADNYTARHSAILHMAITRSLGKL